MTTTTKTSKRNPAWTPEQNKIIADAYVALAVAQAHGIKVVKAELVRGLMAKTGRSRGSVEAKFMNYSASAAERGALPFLPAGYVKGYVPAGNRQRDVDLHLCEAINRSFEALCLIHGRALEA